MGRFARSRLRRVNPRLDHSGISQGPALRLRHLDCRSKYASLTRRTNVDSALRDAKDEPFESRLLLLLDAITHLLPTLCHQYLIPPILPKTDRLIRLTTTACLVPAGTALTFCSTSHLTYLTCTLSINPPAATPSSRSSTSPPQLPPRPRYASSSSFELARLAYQPSLLPDAPEPSSFAGSYFLPLRITPVNVVL